MHKYQDETCHTSSKIILNFLARSCFLFCAWAIDDISPIFQKHVTFILNNSYAYLVFLVYFMCSCVILLSVYFDIQCHNCSCLVFVTLLASHSLCYSFGQSHWLTLSWSTQLVCRRALFCMLMPFGGNLLLHLCVATTEGFLQLCLKYVRILICLIKTTASSSIKLSKRMLDNTQSYEKYVSQ